MKNIHMIKSYIPLTISFWITAEGFKIRFEDLEYNHIENIVRKFGPIVNSLSKDRLYMLEGVLKERARRNNEEYP